MTASGRALIQCVDVTKRYGKTPPALEKVSFSLNRGEFLFLVGPSGAGKTTLLKLLFGEERPTSGEILIENRNIARLPEPQIPYLRRSIGFIFQDFRLLADRTLFENISLPMVVARRPRREIQRRVGELLEMVRLPGRVGDLPGELSAGEQQRVAIARALANRPILLLADEPTGNLDRQRSNEILDLLKEVNALGTTMIMATHDEGRLARLHARKIVLKEGRLSG